MARGSCMSAIWRGRGSRCSGRTRRIKGGIEKGRGGRNEVNDDGAGAGECETQRRTRASIGKFSSSSTSVMASTRIVFLHK